MPEPPGTSAIFPAVGRLRFADDLEPSFAGYHAEHSRPFVRLGLVLALLLYALFGVLDRFIVPGEDKWIWVIRYAIFCPVALAALGLTFTRGFCRVMQPALAAVAAVAGLGIVAMIAIASPSAGYLYYAGLLLVVPWVYTVLQLRFWYAAAACLAIMIGYETVAVWLKPTPPRILVNNNFFFLSAVILGVVAGYTIERGLRTDFLQRRVIEDQRAELAVHNVQLDSALQESMDGLRRQAAELQASRARIVAAADSARRRIERDLHDGAQQQLVALRISLAQARETVASSPAQAAELLCQTERQAGQALAEMRELAHGIYPPLLADVGLAAALQAQARKAAVPVTVEAEVGRYGQDVEAAVYFCVLEALQNVAKYARASAAKVTLGQDGQHLTFIVADDGRGFDPATTPLGTGLQGLADRLAALGGTIDIASIPGRGTRITGQVPATTIDTPSPATQPPNPGG
jgi:signal transduction histidine kinase